MHYLIAMIYFVLALIGVDGFGSHALVTRIDVNGIDVLYSKALVTAHGADFACIASASGDCHYRILPRGCAAALPAAATTSTCTPASARSFILPMGARRKLAGLPAIFTLCVGPGADPAAADCETLPAFDPLASLP